MTRKTLFGLPAHVQLALVAAEIGVLIALRVYYVMRRKERLPMGSKVESIQGKRVIRWPGRFRRRRAPLPAAQFQMSKLNPDEP